ncbi:hypothetical protein, partial [Klebsiella pneumoniae]|uniref:hypothetical protein n=1 Tax=Klebsiella pneumoniae TaxID=573 RepID=UPI003EBDAF15
RDWQARQEKNEKKVKEIFGVVNEHVESDCDVDEVRRVGKYEKGKSRPLKVRLASEKMAQDILRWSWRLNKENWRSIMIRKELSEEEREVLRGMKDEVKKKNEERSEEDKEKFFWRIREMRVTKWYIARKAGGVGERGAAAGTQEGRM